MQNITQMCACDSVAAEVHLCQLPAVFMTSGPHLVIAKCQNWATRGPNVGQKKADFFLVQKEKKNKKKPSYKKANFMRAKCILNMYVFGFYFNHVLHTPHSQLHVVACVLLQDSFQWK